MTPPCGARSGRGAAALPWARAGSAAAPGRHPRGRTFPCTPTRAHPPECTSAQTRVHPCARKRVSAPVRACPPRVWGMSLPAHPHAGVCTRVPVSMHTCTPAGTHGTCTHTHTCAQPCTSAPTGVHPPQCHPPRASSPWGWERGPAEPALAQAGSNPPEPGLPPPLQPTWGFPCPPRIQPRGHLCSCLGVGLSPPALLPLGRPQPRSVALGVPGATGHPRSLLLRHFLAPATPQGPLSPASSPSLGCSPPHVTPGLETAARVPAVLSLGLGDDLSIWGQRCHPASVNVTPGGTWGGMERVWCPARTPGTSPWCAQDARAHAWQRWAGGLLHPPWGPLAGMPAPTREGWDSKEDMPRGPWGGSWR